MGSIITLKLLTMNPERFLTSTLGGNGGILAPTELELTFFEQLSADMGKGSLRSLIVWFTPKGQPPPPEEEMKRGERMLLSGKDTTALAALVQAMPELAVSEAQVAAINIPTTAIVGTADPAIEGVNKLKKGMPQLNVVPIAEATQMNAFGRPEFIAALQEHLKAHSRGAVQ